MITDFLSIWSLKARLPEVFLQMEVFFPRSEAVAIAVSWGSDSMVLALAMIQFWSEKKRDLNQLFFLHCNHKLRKESDEEEIQMRKLFDRWNLAVFERWEGGDGSEEALRERRYAQFRVFMQEKWIARLAIGHNLSDRVEGTLLNLLRGCGLQWFLWMRGEQEHYLLDERQVIRPLLGISKERIKKIADELDIPYFEDKTNDENSISRRNLVRNQFLNPFSELSLGNGVERSFWNSWRGIYAELEQEKNLGAEFLQVIKRNPYRWSSQAFEWCLPRGMLSEKALVDCLSALNIVVKWGEMREIFDRLSKSEDGIKKIWWWNVFIAHERRYFIKSEKEFWLKELFLEKEVKEIWIQIFGLFQVEVWEDLLWTKIRFPRSDDQFQWKTLKKRMINQKIPIFWRNSLPLAEKDGKVIFVWKPEMLLF